MALLPLYLLAVLAFIGYLLVRSNQKLREREQERCRVTVEERVPAFQWPPRPRPAVAEAHPRNHERIAPMAGGRG